MYEKAADGWAKHLDFIVLDVICLEIALAIAYMMRHGVSNWLCEPRYRNLTIVVFFIDFVLLQFLDTLKNVLKRGYYKEFVRTLYQSVLLVLCVTAYMFATQEGTNYSRLTIFNMGVIYLLLSYLTRLLLKRYLLRHVNREIHTALLVVSSEQKAPSVFAKIREHNYEHYTIRGLVCHDAEKVGRIVDGVPVVATYATVADYVRDRWVDEVLLAVPEADPYPRGLIEQLTAMGLTVHMSLDKSKELVGLKQLVGNVGGLAVITSTLNYMSRRQSFEKRLLDIIGGLVGCIFTGIVYLFVAPAIKRESPGPVFFTQTRVGKNGKQFKIYKFRSMYLDAEARKAELMSQNRIQDGMMFKMAFDPRIIGNRIDANGNRVTGIGEFIRKYSLDEFPQFFNVLKGDMSLVGTRPPTLDEFEKYEYHHRARLAIRPGITGMWQVSGRSNILDFEEVVRLDTEYINNWSLGMDIKILLKTVLAVVKKDGSM